MRVTQRLGWLALAGLAMACGGDSDNGMNSDLSIAKAAADNGDLQTAATEATLADSIKIVVLEDGVPKEGVTVHWSAQGAEAAVSPNNSVTDANGLAATTWTLGLTSGDQTARASLSGAGGSPVTFHATATGGNGAIFGNTFFRSNHNRSSDPAVDTIAAGTQFTWTGTGGDHTVRSQGATSFTSSGTLGDGDTYNITFNTPGTYQYDCEIHGGDMTGRIVVTP